MYTREEVLFLNYPKQYPRSLIHYRNLSKELTNFLVILFCFKAQHYFCKRFCFKNVKTFENFSFLKHKFDRLNNWSTLAFYDVLWKICGSEVEVGSVNQLQEVQTTIIPYKPLHMNLILFSFVIKFCDVFKWFENGNQTFTFFPHS